MKKLIREKITEKLKPGEWETITDIDELNRLYALKIQEELAEIQNSGHNDIMEFVDLIAVAFAWAKINGFTESIIDYERLVKSFKNGDFKNTVLNNLNPENPSNKIYFEQ